MFQHAVSLTRDFLQFAGARRLLGVASLLLLGGVVEGISIAILLPLLGSLTGGEGPLQRGSDIVFAWVGAGDAMARLTVTLCAFVCAMIIRGLVLMTRDRAVTALQARYVEHCRSRLLGALAQASWRDVAGLQHARITQALSVEVARVAMSTHAGLNIAVSATMLTAQLALTLVLAWAVGVAAMAMMAAAAAVSVGRIRRSAGFGDDMRRNGLKLAHTAGQLLGGLKQAAAENRQGAFVADFNATGGAMVALQIDDKRRSSRFHFLTSITVALAGAVVLLGGMWSGADTAALLAATLVLSRMAGHAVGLQRDCELLASALPGHGMLTDLERELRCDDARPFPAGVPPAGEIRLERVGYLHDTGQRGVRDASLSISPGEVVGITGPSGAGKTTLIDLMIGLLPARRGTILIGGEVLDVEAAWRWRNRVAYVGQDAFLTHDTIRANLAPDRSAEVVDDVLWAALDQVEVGDVVRAMPEGLNTVLAERGSRLSGGERQRIAIARALLRHPALLILDEATNAIDVPTERLILNRLKSVDPTMTILVVAHRRETLVHCPRVVTIADGRVTADRRRKA